MRQVICIAIGVILGAGLGLSTGWYGAGMRYSRADVAVSIPLHLAIHEAIRTGNTNKAMEITRMALRGKVKKMQSLTNSVVFRVVSRDKFQSPQFQKRIRMASEVLNTNYGEIFISTNVLQQF